MSAARGALACAALLVAVMLAYAVAALTVRPADLLTLWVALLALLSAALVEVQRRLLGSLFAGQPVSPPDWRWGWFTRLFRLVVLLGAAQLALLALAFTLSPAVGRHPLADFLFLVGWAAAIYASFWTYLSLSVAFLRPRDPDVRRVTREWLWRFALAGGVFLVMNVSASLREADAWAWPGWLASGLYVLGGGLRVMLAVLTWRALQEQGVED